jgi:uncharacterized protein YgiM (DUF1202 family)
MNQKASPPSLTIIWRITAAVAVVLLILTLILVFKTSSASTASFTGYVNDRIPTVYLRSQPTHNSRTVAILNSGSEVLVDRSTTRQETTWYHITSSSGSGWIPETNLSLSKP